MLRIHPPELAFTGWDPRIPKSPVKVVFVLPLVGVPAFKLGKRRTPRKALSKLSPALAVG